MDFTASHRAEYRRKAFAPAVFLFFSEIFMDEEKIRLTTLAKAGG